MKDFTHALLFGAALLTATAATAQTFRKQSVAAPQDRQSLRTVLTTAKAPSAVSLPIVSQDVVEEQPEGKLFANQAYSNTYHYYNFDGGIESGSSDAILINYVLAPDSTIWLHSPISLLETGWLRLDHVGGTSYVAHTPQAMIYDEYDVDDDGNPYKSYATRLVLKNFGDGFYYYPDTISGGSLNLDLHFTFEDGILRQVQDSVVADMSNMPYEVLGLTNAEGSWLGYCDGSMRVFPITETASQVPEGVEPKFYVLTDSSLNGTTGKFSVTRQLVHMATNGTDAYLAAPDGSGGWIHGTYQNDGSISFKRQYLGPSALYNSHVWFRPATYSVQQFDDNEDEPWGASFDFGDELVFRPTADGFSTTAPNALVINASPNRVNYAAAYFVPSLNVFNEVATTPADPSVFEFYPYDEDNGFSMVTVDVPVTDATGNLLNTAKLSYEIYYDSAATAHTFTTADYPTIAEELTEIPFSFQNGEDFFISEYGRTIYIYDGQPERVGVQSIYRGAGAERRSNIVWSDGTVTDGISSATVSPEGTRAAAAVYDLQGRSLKKPASGLNIVRLADGSVKKIVVK